LNSTKDVIIYTAASNLTDNPPKGYESGMYLADPPKNWRPAYNIPTWYRAARYFIQNEQPVPTAVQCMLEANYFKFNCVGRFDLSKSWGYSAIADHLGI
jgi:hypothetical protein